MPDDYKTLDVEYRENTIDSEYYDALNQLNDIDRSLFIQFIEHKCKYRPLCRKMNVSVRVLKRQIDDIRCKIKNNYFGL